MKQWLTFLVLWLAGSAQADEAPSLPRVATDAATVMAFPWRAVQDVPDFFRKSNPSDNAAAYLWLGASTLALIAADQPIIDESQRFAYRIGLISANDDGRQSRVLVKNSVFGIGADLRVPVTPNSYLYYLGDGLTTVLVTGGLFTFGGLAGDVKAVSAGSQILEALTLTGMFIITGKMATGREAPFRASIPGGRWRGFEGFKAYLTDVSKHDAFPSGHIATLTATFRILAENYFTQPWVLYTGYGCAGVLMWSMLNNGEHWASDYPLGIAIGYTASGVVLDRHLGPERPGRLGSMGTPSSFSILPVGDGLLAQKTWLF